MPRRARRYMGMWVTSSLPNEHVAHSGRDETNDHIEGGRLPGAILAEQADHLARGDVDIDAVDHAPAAVLFDQPLGLDEERRVTAVRGGCKAASRERAAAGGSPRPGSLSTERAVPAFSSSTMEGSGSASGCPFCLSAGLIREEWEDAAAGVK